MNSEQLPDTQVLDELNKKSVEEAEEMLEKTETPQDTPEDAPSGSLKTYEMAGSPARDVIEDIVEGFSETPENAGIADSAEEEPEERDAAQAIYDKNLAELTALMDLPLVELYSQRNLLKHSLKDLEDAKKMMDSMPNDVDGMNTLHEIGMDEKLEDFMNKYDELHADGERAINVITHAVHQVPVTVSGSIAFLSSSMIQSCKMRLESGKELSDRSRKQLTRNIDAYQHRYNADVVINKLRYVMNVKKVQDRWFAMDPAKSMAYIDKILSPIFSDEHMSRFRTRMMLTVQHIFENSKNGIGRGLTHYKIPDLGPKIFMFTYWLATVYENSIDSGLSCHVKVFIMNVYDAVKNKAMEYDIAGGVELEERTLRLAFSLFLLPASYSKSELKSKDVRALVDSMIKAYEIERDGLLKEHPGKPYTEDTRLSAICSETTAKELADELADLANKIDEMDESDDGVVEEADDELSMEDESGEEIREIVRKSDDWEGDDEEDEDESPAEAEHDLYAADLEGTTNPIQLPEEPHTPVC